MRRPTLLILLVILSTYLFAPKPEAKAMEPVTIALLAPVALQVANQAKPYIIRGIKNGAVHMLTMGKDVLDIMRLPLGVVQSTVLMPFAFSSGIKNMVKGGVAPFKLAFHAAILPLKIIGM